MMQANLTPTQEAALETNYGLTMPGRCDTCGKYGPRYKFYNEYTSYDGPIEYDLCPRCITNAVRCVDIFLRLEEKHGRA